VKAFQLNEMNVLSTSLQGLIINQVPAMIPTIHLASHLPVLVHLS